jgi:glycosyltransferase involved in cell wall biosynthesis
MVALEAMAGGVPIIASDVIGNHEFIGDAGLLVNPPNPVNFARDINRLLDNRKLANKFIFRGKNKALAHRWQEVVNKFEKVYREAIDENI